ncbi:MAG TPA: amidohydrolase [Actinomycetota bacterium]|nr:amidohydrolase [Actinomycetota bacterium]
MTGATAEPRILIRDLDFAITVDASNTVVRNASILIEGTRVVALGPTSEVATDDTVASVEQVIDGHGLGASPGFVDAHVHLSETLSRAAFADTLSTRPWVFHWVMPYYGQLLAEDERVAVTIAAWEMLRSGTTCFLDMGALNDPAVTVRALGEIGIRGVTGRHAADVRPSTIPEGWTPEMVEHHFFSNANAALEALRETVQSWDGYADGRIRCWVNLQGKELCSQELFVEARRLAEELGVGSTYHLASTLEEADGSERTYGVRPITRMASLGALGPNVVLAHAVATTDDEIEILARLGTKVAFCPGTSLKLAKGATAIGRYPEMLEAGVVVGLGTDGVSASGNLSLMRQLYLAAGLYKDARMDPSLVGASRALRMATIDGARALGLDADIGSLETGKQADLVLFDLSHPEWVPFADPVQALVWSASPASIVETWVAGRRLYHGGRVETIPDIESLVEDARARAAAIVRAAGLDRPTVPTETTLYT